MPVVHVYGFPRSIAARRKLAKNVTEAVCKSYDVSPEIVTVYIFDVAKDQAAHAGMLASDAEAPRRAARKRPPDRRAAGKS